MRRLLWLLLPLLLVGWLAAFLLQRPPQEPAAPSPLVSSEPQAPPTSASGPKPLSRSRPGQADAGLTLTGRLLPGSDGRLPDWTRTEARLGHAARVGIGAMDEEHRAEYELWLEQGGEGAGPSHPDELVNIVRWRPVPLRMVAPDRAELGPVVVPPAPLYRIQIVTDSGQVYLAEVRPPHGLARGILHAGELAPIPPTGLRIRRSGPSDQTFPVRLGRADDPLAAAAVPLGLDALLGWAYPDLAAAYRGERPLQLEPGVSTLMPLIPEPVVRLLPTGGEPIVVALAPGRIVDLDLSDDQRAYPVALQGRLVVAGTSEPIPKAVIDGEHGEQVITDAEGRFRFEALPGDRETSFQISREAPPPGERPRLPDRHAVRFDPQAHRSASGDIEAEVTETWEVPVYRWLVLDLDPAQREALQPGREQVYPIHRLERQDGTRWRATGVDHFLPEPDGVAVSLTAPGRYRVAVYASPTERYTSTVGDLTAGTEEARVRLLPTAPRDHTLEFRLAGQPLADTAIRVFSPDGLPPLETRTDAAGRLRLSVAGLSSLHLQFGQAGVRETELVLPPGRVRQTVELEKRTKAGPSR